MRAAPSSCAVFAAWEWNDVTTTNKTDFFREAGHFDYLVSQALPDLAARMGANRKSLVWSAGCSTGEEPYTLAMVLSEYSQTYSGFRFGVLATDICTAVLAKASMGIFKSELVKPVPQTLRRKYFMRSRDPGSDLLRVVPELRALVDFKRVNFMDDDFSLPHELAPYRADCEERSGPCAEIGEIEEMGQWLRRLYQILHRHLCNSTLRPEVASAGSQWIYRLGEART